MGPVTNALRVLVYSSDSDTRAQVIGALGPRLDADGPELSYYEVATEPMVFAQLDSGSVDAAILDGEASPAGGLGIAKQMKDEYDPAPPTLVLLGRADDRWLADWSRTEATAVLPVDPLALSTSFAQMLRTAGITAGS
ncbi:hypothetical protein GII30_21735 [Gordonia amarae]|uniref:Uncharacterized protein n=1 Tax=Gordonia amarae TaxID=36821 RepID=A0A857KQ91_9ACTN|nr:hypothetical protein GII35_22030 [Gordonia amarae]QHN23770.1 hypothetical protein GII34_21530 [Gordonia amarae]QHN32682.1 hypothetical protein GII32_21860 [Gordonia amarae]QHN41430.1 hypothetical protein GII30_21735 [Gordonia amarae]